MQSAMAGMSSSNMKFYENLHQKYFNKAKIGKKKKQAEDEEPQRQEHDNAGADEISALTSNRFSNFNC